MLILECFYFMLPVYFANMAPVLTKKLFKFLAKPVKKSIFGSNKTWRGLIIGIIFAIIIFYIQKLININSLIDYSQYTLLLGFLLGLGAVLGDLIKSFFKRIVNIKPGKPWIPFDQLDFVIGALLLASIIYIPTLKAIIIIIILTFVLHILINHTAYWLKIRKEKW